jgi:glycosyltransferase involved in cell wall biosynthesis
VRDLEVDWPAMTVVVCAYNASATVEECLTHARALDYPDLEVLLVDDGSTDDTADIAERVCAGDPRMRVIRAAHQGLSGARNTGWQSASGDLVVYLDSDAFPTPEWPYYLAIGLDGPLVGGVGGPNLPPPGGSLAPSGWPGRPADRCTSCSPTTAPSTSRREHGLLARRAGGGRGVRRHLHRGR